MMSSSAQLLYQVFCLLLPSGVHQSPLERKLSVRATFCSNVFQIEDKQQHHKQHQQDLATAEPRSRSGSCAGSSCPQCALQGQQRPQKAPTDQSDGYDIQVRPG
jgi:hypothetical protein